MRKRGSNRAGRNTACANSDRPTEWPGATANASRSNGPERATAAAGQANAELSGINHGDGGPTKEAPKRTSQLAVRTLHVDLPCRLVLSRWAVEEVFGRERV